jgi:hypothetical protein
MPTRDLIEGLMLYAVFPTWLIAGFADYLCHRKTDIEYTSGRAESLLHAAQYLEILAAVALGLFLEITTLVLLLMILLVVAHTLTAFWDVSFTEHRRDISPLEQHIHGYLEMLPLFALCLVAILSWESFAPLLTGEFASFTIRSRAIPLPTWVVVIVLGGLSLSGLAIAEELWRTSKKGAEHAEIQ